MQATKEALNLLMQGSRLFSRMEANGIRIDVPYLEEAIRTTGNRIKELEEELTNSKTFDLWRRRFRHANIGSNKQLQDILTKDLGIKLTVRTDSGEDYKLDESVLEGIDNPWVKSYGRWKKLSKAKKTFLEGIRTETVDGFLHPFFNLHTTISYRSSSSEINFQNFPTRDAEIGELVRRAFIARPGHQLLEIDFKAIEVAIAACYHKDPAMLAYIKDSSKDMHRDMAMECYMLTKSQVSKDARYCAKNKFVFPQFYGDYYVDCAKHLWEAIDRMKLKTTDGIPIKAHLYGKGITKLGRLDPEREPIKGTYEEYIKSVERNFWEKRFPVYNQWKRDWWKAYLERGYIDTLTGFHIEGVYKRNQIINLPVQGSAFHCLLWTLIQLDKWLQKERMQSLIVGQVHDSGLLDAAENEIPKILEKVTELVTYNLPRAWKWIIVPLSVEAELSPKGGSWFDKKPVHMGV